MGRGRAGQPRSRRAVQPLQESARQLARAPQDDSSERKDKAEERVAACAPRSTPGQRSAGRAQARSARKESRRQTARAKSSASRPRLRQKDRAGRKEGRTRRKSKLQRAEDALGKTQDSGQRGRARAARGTWAPASNRTLTRACITGGDSRWTMTCWALLSQDLAAQVCLGEGTGTAGQRRAHPR